VSRGGRERERFSDPDASWGHRSAVSTARAVGSTATESTHSSAPARTSPSRGASRRPRATRLAMSRRCSTLRTHGGSLPRRAPWTRAMTWGRSTTLARSATAARSSRFARRRPSCAAITSRRRASTGSGRSPVGREARPIEVALPDGRVPPGVPVGQGRPPASARAARDAAVEDALPGPRGSRARVRAVEAQVGVAAAPGPGTGNGSPYTPT